jgi:acyl-CoA synthetase (AMP-forming)/AMP-acid ligase II/acyl carrier protein
MTHHTLVDILTTNRGVAKSIHYHNGEHDERRVSFTELYDRALGVLWHLQQRGAKRGDKLIIFLNHNEHFINGFWAALSGSIIPVPLAVGISDEHRHKLIRIAKKLGNPFIYTDQKQLDRLGEFAASVGESAVFEKLAQRAILTESLSDLTQAGSLTPPTPEDIAFIQFSSGSTSEPKGIVLTHKNVIANVRSATAAAAFNDKDISLSWMPLTHDMGLIGKHLFMLANQIESHLMPTELFIRRPLLWLTIATRIGATILGSPNFGYRHYLKVLGERAVEQVDLRTVRVIFNGAEPIAASLCDEFMQRLSPHGLNPNTMFPVYGLAEASLAVTFPALQTPYRVARFDRHRLAVGMAAGFASEGSRDALTIMNVGRAIPGTEVRIVAEDKSALPEGHVGHLLIKGDNVTHGYFEAPELNAQLISSDGWLDTGDLGVLIADQLFITGRAKEIIFVNGQNYYPHDLEAIAQTAPSMELGKVVAAGCRPMGSESDQLTFFVLHRGTPDEFAPIATAIRRLINEHTGLEVAHVVPVKRIPKTTSGKVQRVALENAFVAGEFADEMALLERHAAHTPVAAPTQISVESSIQGICNALLPDKNLSATDNLFEIGASSLTLIQIHEHIDQLYPGLIDLTELFDYPTVASLASHLEQKIQSANA